MREAYIEVALEIGESWDKLKSIIQRSIGVINVLISNINLHLSNDILCKQLSERVIQSSNYMIINDYCDRIKNLCVELLGFLDQFHKNHFSDINKTIKWINDEYSFLNHLNCDKSELMYANKRVLTLYKSLILCTSIENSYNILYSTVSTIEKNIDYYVQYIIIKSEHNGNLCGGTTNTEFPLKTDIIDKFNELSNFVCYDGSGEVKIIKNYVENG
ncbi:hypothetical protein FG379_001119 [Cryptosporidium bovis]|uniref:uncharacterized protein n=1 Tax=Cryptosporidium bovis TaxID=310047 RepID=UPI00351A9178|nr:hypothetical protein FG379_001119 [Cryptosporidium bovis]